MTVFLPSTTLTVFRGAAVDDYGDETDTTLAIALAVPAAVTEVRQRSWRPVEQRGGVADRYTIRLRPGVDVTEEDRLRDDNTGAIYQVQEVNKPARIVGAPDLRITAVRIAAHS